jgi:hypothetical protein
MSEQVGGKIMGVSWWEMRGVVMWFLRRLRRVACDGGVGERLERLDFGI